MLLRRRRPDLRVFIYNAPVLCSTLSFYSQGV